METPKKEKSGIQTGTETGQGGRVKDANSTTGSTSDTVSDATVSGASPERARHVPNTTSSEQVLMSVSRVRQQVCKIDQDESVDGEDMVDDCFQDDREVWEVTHVCELSSRFTSYNKNKKPSVYETCRRGLYRVYTQPVTKIRGQGCGDIELDVYLANTEGPCPWYWTYVSHMTVGEVGLTLVLMGKYNIIIFPLTLDISFMFVVGTTSGHLHCELVLLLFLQTHGETDRVFAVSVQLCI
jgi:hypothetical protein